MHTFWLLLNHTVNFFMPAFFLAVLMALAGRWRAGALGAASASLWRHIKINSWVGGSVSLLGLIVLGQDGKMWTYVALVISIALAQWGQVRK